MNRYRLGKIKKRFFDWRILGFVSLHRNDTRRFLCHILFIGVTIEQPQNNPISPAI